VDSHGDEIQPGTHAGARCTHVGQQVTRKLQSRRCGLLMGKLHPQQRVPQGLRSGASAATILSLGPHLHGLLNGTRIQKGDGRVAVWAFDRVFQIDRPSALRAAYLADLRPDPLELRRSQAADKLFFPQKLEEGRESPVTMRAPEIRKPAGLGQVEAEHQGTVATRAGELVCDGLTGVIPMRLDFPEQLDNGGGREFDAGQVVKPYSGAGKAKLHPHGAVIVSFELLGVHRLPAIGAGDRGKGINLGHEWSLGRDDGERWMSRIEHSLSMRTRIWFGPK